jgi:hypothetical protein
VHDPLINWRLVENEIEESEDQAKVHKQEASTNSMDEQKLALEKPSFLLNLKLGKGNDEIAGSLPNAQPRVPYHRKNTAIRRDPLMARQPATPTKDAMLVEELATQAIQPQEAKEKSAHSMLEKGDDEGDYGHKTKELLNEQALSIVNRVKEKLTGTARVRLSSFVRFCLF